MKQKTTHSTGRFLITIPISLIIVFIFFFGIYQVSETISKQEQISDTLIVQHGMRATNYLEELQNTNGQIIVGRQPVFNVWDTVQAVRAISLWRHRSEELSKSKVIPLALTFLKNSEHPSGMVLHNNIQKHSYCVETSAEYIKLLAFLEENNLIRPGMATKKADYLKDKQLNKGSWEIESFEIPVKLQQLPSVTAFAMQGLASTDTPPLDMNAALNYLKTTQQKDGHWGVAWEYYGTPFYVIMPVLQTLCAHNGKGAFDDTIKKAKDFILASQLEDGCFSSSLKDGPDRPSVELETTLALRALLSCNKRTDVTIDRGIRWLLSQQQQDGSWNGGDFPWQKSQFQKKEDVFCTSQALILLDQYLNKKKNE